VEPDRRQQPRSSARRDEAADGDRSEVRTHEREGPGRHRLPLWWHRLAERWAPEGLRAARVDPGRRGALALTVAMLAAALVVSMLVWRARPRVEPMPPPPITAAAPTASGAAVPSAVAAPLVVAVTGRVRRPGVVTVPAGARVIDALRAAGGPLPGADLALLNLARKLTDGELVVVGVPGAVDPAGQPAAGAGSGGGAPGPIDLNIATLAQLDTLPGVGPVLAQRILDWRTEHGRFTNVDQLADVAGIGESRLSQLRDLVRV
jgi:competence protein ComEA